MRYWFAGADGPFTVESSDWVPSSERGVFGIGVFLAAMAISVWWSSETREKTK